MQPILHVHTVDLLLFKSLPPVLVINALGEVNSGGWHHATLLPRFHPAPPADGIADYDFVAEPPSGPAIAVISPIVAQTTLTDPPAWLRGIRVHSATNLVLAPLGDATRSIAPSEHAIRAAAATANAALATRGAPTPRKISLAMKLDPDVSFYETGVWLEGRYVDGWSRDEKNGAYVRTFEQFPVASPLDVHAACRSRNEPNLKGALSLALAIAGGTPSVLTVETKNFIGHAEAQYHV